MPENPNMLDYSAKEKDREIVIFPDGTKREIPTPAQPTLEALAWLEAHAEEWHNLYTKAHELKAKDRKRWEYLNESLMRSMFPDVAEKTIRDLDTTKQAQLILRFTTASPELLKYLEELQAEARAEVSKILKAERKPTTRSKSRK